MNIEIKVPAVGESITEVQIAEWRVSIGDTVTRDQVLLTIDSDKATVEISASAAGRLASILKPKGAMAKVGDVLGVIESGETSVVTAGQPSGSTVAHDAGPASGLTIAGGAARVMPAAARLLAEHQIKPESVTATGPGGRLLKEDVLHVIESSPPATPQPEAARAPATQPMTAGSVPVVGDGSEEVVPMSPLRRTVARRLVEAQHTMAILTTFNEVDLSAVMALRQENQEAFQARHGVKLGFMSFFVKAAIEALKRVPQLNAEVRGTDIVYHHRYDLGVAIASTKGLVVPVLRAAERLGLAEIERAIADFAQRARDNQLKPEEIQGGTFTISNGGVFGSMLSTPIINPPQTGVLGMHTIQDRPVARGGQVVIRPMMYLALSYDHRIVDGKEAVTFLKHVKDLVENPARILLEL